MQWHLALNNNERKFLLLRRVIVHNILTIIALRYEQIYGSSTKVHACTGVSPEPERVNRRTKIYIYKLTSPISMRGPKRSRTLLKLTIFSLPAELASALEEFIKMKARVFEIQHTGEQEVSGEVS